MFKKCRFSLVIIDVAGGLVVTACALGTLWLTVIGNDDTAAETRRLKKSIDQARQALEQVREDRDEQDVLLVKIKAELEERGRLPEQTPIEDYFQTLGVLTAKHHLRVLRQNPLAPRQYPGLLEQRYAYILAGSTPDLAGFLRAIERTNFWADISYLSIESRPDGGQDGSSGRVAELTLSLFSAMPVDSATGKG